MNYVEWSKTVPAWLTTDALWTVEAYRLALFAADLAWRDVSKLMQDNRTRELASQLFRAVGSIGANVSEGYCRGSGKDRARFYEYALGSARESRTWYFDGRHVLGDRVADHRMNYLTQLIRLLLAMIPDQRGKYMHEEAPAYQAGDSKPAGQFSPAFLASVPLP